MDSERYQDRITTQGESAEIASYREVARQGNEITCRDEKIGGEKEIREFDDYINGNGKGYKLPEKIHALKGRKISKEDYQRLVLELNSLDYSGSGVESVVESGKQNYMTIDGLLETAQELHVPCERVVSVLEKYAMENSQKQLSESVRDISKKLESKLYGFLDRAVLEDYKGCEVVKGDGFFIRYNVEVGKGKESMKVKVESGRLNIEGLYSHLFSVSIGKKHFEEVPSLRGEVRVDDWNFLGIVAAGVFYPLVLLGVSIMSLDENLKIKDTGKRALHDLTILPFYKVPRHFVRKAVRGVKTKFAGNEIIVSDAANQNRKMNLEEYIINLTSDCDTNTQTDKDGISERAKMVKFAFENMDSAIKKDLGDANKFLSDWKV